MTIDVSNNDSNEQDVQQAKENKHTLHVLRKCVTVLRAHEVEFFYPTANARWYQLHTAAHRFWSYPKPKLKSVSNKQGKNNYLSRTGATDAPYYD